MDALPRQPKWRRYLRFWRVDVGSDVDDELRFHLESRIEGLMATGVSREAAVSQALSEMGDVTNIREQVTAIDQRVLRRQSRLERWRILGIELRHALRRLRSTPGFTVAAALTMVIAIGGTASVFGLVDGVLLKAFPYRDPERVLAIFEASPSRGFPKFPVSPANYLDYRAQNSGFAGLAAEHYLDLTAVGTQEPERLVTLAVTPNYFLVLGLTPVLGRALSPDSAGPDEVVISYPYWQRRFAGSTGVLGQKITLDEAVKVGGELPKQARTYTVVGVMPQGLPGDTTLWTRLSFTGADQLARGSHYLVVHGRLKPGVRPDAARHELEAIAQRLAKSFPRTNEGWSVVSFSLLDELVGTVKPALIMLLAAATCVLLIGAANLANLFLVRFVAREREMALRTALGATRRRLVRELVAEAAILGATTGALGVGAAVVGVRALRALAPPTLPRLEQVGVDARVVFVCAVVSIVTVFVFGVLPAWRVSQGDLAAGLKEGGRGTGSAAQLKLQSALVVAQVVMAVVLLTGASLLVRGFERLERADKGFRPDSVLTAMIVLPAQRYPTPERQDQFMMRAIAQVRALPGVRQASVSDALPSMVGWHFPFSIIGDPPPDQANLPSADLVCVSADYFRTLGIRLKAGRSILATDDRRAQGVVVADELVVQRFFKGREPVGRRLLVGGDTVVVVGVVGSVRQRGLAKESKPELYAPFSQCPGGFDYLSVRTTGDPETQVAAIRRAMTTLDPNVPVSDFRSLNAVVAQSISTTRFSSFLASLFAMIALALGIIGIYSVLAYVVTQRQREIAVRIALGARPDHVVADVVRQAIALAGIGIALGSLMAWVLTRALAGIFLGISPHDPGSFLAAAAAFGLVAIAAASVPAWRATRVNPVVALTST